MKSANDDAVTKIEINAATSVVLIIFIISPVNLKIKSNAKALFESKEISYKIYI